MNRVRIPSYIVSHRTLLTEQEEKKLFKGWQATKAKPLLDYIVRAYSPIVLKFAKKLSGYGMKEDDLIDEGTLALIEAAHRYEIGRGLRFATYARGWVEGLMLAFIAKNYFTMNVNSNQRMKKLFFNLRRVIAQEYKKGNPEGDPTFFHRIAEKMNVKVEDVEAMHSLFSRPAESLSTPLGGDSDDNDFTRESTLQDPNETPDEVVMTTMLNAYHRKLIADIVNDVLTKREARVFMAQVVANDQSLRTLQNLADELSLSRERVRQVREIALAKVRKALLARVPKERRKEIFRD